MTKNKKKNTIFKVCTLFVMALLCIISFVVPTKAYYQDQNGNLQSQNLFNINDTDNIAASTSSITYSISENNLLIINNGGGNWARVQYSLFNLSANTTYTLSFTQSELTYCYIFDNNNYIYRGDGQQLERNLVQTFTTTSVFNTLYIAFYDSLEMGNTISNIMLNSGSTALSYEPYGIYYSQTNYNNYGAIEYGSGFAEGRDSVYESMTYQKISRLVTNTAIAKYDINNSSLVNLVQISDISYNGDNLFLDWSANSNDNGYWYRISISWSNSYIIKSVGFTPSSWSQAILDINGFQSSNVSYNGSYFGWFEVNKIYNGGTNNIEIQFKYNGGATFEGVNIYVDAFNEFALNSQAAFNEGYEQGVNVGKAEGYSTGYSEGINQATTNIIGWKGLFFSMADLPFKTVSNFLGFEVLGVNLFKAFIGFITVLGILWVFKRLVK